MTDKREDSGRLQQAVRTRQRRREQGRRDSEPSLAQNLSLIGALGAMIVLPTLIGIFGGRWLDHHFHTGVFWTFGLLIAGLAIGCAGAWNRIYKA